MLKFDRHLIGDLLDAPAGCGVVVLLPSDLLDASAGWGVVVLLPGDLLDASAGWGVVVLLPSSCGVVVLLPGDLLNTPAGCDVVVLLPGNLELSSSSTLSYGPWKSALVAFLLTGSHGGWIGMTSGWSCPDSDTQNAQFHSCHLQPHNNSESSYFPCYIIMNILDCTVMPSTMQIYSIKKLDKAVSLSAPCIINHRS